MRFRLAVALLLSATTLVAAPVITSISSTTGPVTGGTTVTISGTGFSDACPPMSGCTTGVIKVFFGGAPATAVQLVDGQTVTAVTPANLPGTVDVVLQQPDGNALLSNAFSYSGGNVTDAFDRILLPVWLPLIQGAYGSSFVTNLTMWNASQSEFQIEGLARVNCGFDPCPVPNAIILPPRGNADATDFTPAGTAATPGKFIYAPKNSEQFIYATLRVQDISRQAQTWGTSIPVVHDSDFRSYVIGLPDIPNDDRFRNTLRVYGDGPGTVFIRVVQTWPSVVKLAEFMLPLNPGATIFDPSYASFSAFPPPTSATAPAVSKMRIEVEPATYLLRIWAFDSVTNNETQHITVITPQ